MATVLDFPADTDRVISATVKALYSGRGLTADDVARAIGVSHGTINSRLRCRTSWTANEVRRLSLMFGVRIDDLYNGLDGTFTGLPHPDPDGEAVVRHEGLGPPTRWFGVHRAQHGTVIPLRRRDCEPTPGPLGPDRRAA